MFISELKKLIPERDCTNILQVQCLRTNLQLAHKLLHLRLASTLADKLQDWPLNVWR